MLTNKKKPIFMIYSGERIVTMLSYEVLLLSLVIELGKYVGRR